MFSPSPFHIPWMDTQPFDLQAWRLGLTFGPSSGQGLRVVPERRFLPYPKGAWRCRMGQHPNRFSILRTNAFAFSISLRLPISQSLFIWTLFWSDAIFSFTLFSEGVPMDDV